MPDESFLERNGTARRSTYQASGSATLKLMRCLFALFFSCCSVRPSSSVRTLALAVSWWSSRMTCAPKCSMKGCASNASESRSPLSALLSCSAQQWSLLPTAASCSPDALVSGSCASLACSRTVSRIARRECAKRPRSAKLSPPRVACDLWRAWPVSCTGLCPCLSQSGCAHRPYLRRSR